MVRLLATSWVNLIADKSAVLPLIPVFDGSRVMAWNSVIHTVLIIVAVYSSVNDDLQVVVVVYIAFTNATLVADSVYSVATCSAPVVFMVCTSVTLC